MGLISIIFTLLTVAAAIGAAAYMWIKKISFDELLDKNALTVFKGFSSLSTVLEVLGLSSIAVAAGRMSYEAALWRFIPLGFFEVITSWWFLSMWSNKMKQAANDGKVYVTEIFTLCLSSLPALLLSFGVTSYIYLMYLESIDLLGMKQLEGTNWWNALFQLDIITNKDELTELDIDNPKRLEASAVFMIYSTQLINLMMIITLIRQHWSIVVINPRTIYSDWKSSKKPSKSTTSTASSSSSSASTSSTTSSSTNTNTSTNTGPSASPGSNTPSGSNPESANVSSINAYANDVDEWLSLNKGEFMNWLYNRIGINPITKVSLVTRETDPDIKSGVKKPSDVALELTNLIVGSGTEVGTLSHIKVQTDQLNKVIAELKGIKTQYEKEKILLASDPNNNNIKINVKGLEQSFNEKKTAAGSIMSLRIGSIRQLANKLIPRGLAVNLASIDSLTKEFNALTC